MTIEGEIVVGVACDGARVRRVAIASTRPFAIARVLAGREPVDAASTLPRLYSLCAHAQRAAAASALDAACVGAVDAARRDARALAVRAESIQEYLRRFLMDDAIAVGDAPDVAPVARVRRVLTPVLAALSRPASTPDEIPDLAGSRVAIDEVVAASVLGMTAHEWSSMDALDAVIAWSRRGATAPARRLSARLDHLPALGASDVATMPSADRDALDAAVVAPLRVDSAYARRPSWHGAPVETGAFARRSTHPLVQAARAAYGNGVATRAIARLTDLASTTAMLAANGTGTVDAWSPSDGEGVAAVHTARGLLVHRAVVAGGKVADYAIVAPTEWNFHPDGALARGVAGLVARDRETLRAAVVAIVQALDPCVACRVEIVDA